MNCINLVRKPFRNLRMRTQIMIIYGIILLITLSFLACAFLVQTLILNDILIIGSKNLLDQQNGKQLYYAIERVKQQLQLRHQSNYHILFTLSELSKFILDTPTLLIEPPHPCVDKIDQDAWTFPRQYFCLITYNLTKENEADLKDLVPLESLISLSTQWIFAYETTIQNRIFFNSKSTVQRGGVYPPAYIQPNFYPHKRSWFINHIKMFDENKSIDYAFSDIFLTTISDYYVYTMTKSILSRDRSLIAVSGLNINISDSQLSRSPYNIYVINSQGQILLSRLEVLLDVQKVHAIYDAESTGFNKDDWEQIKSQAMYKNGSSNCNSAPLSDMFICRWNTLFQQEVQVAVGVQKEVNLTTILVSNISSLNILNKSFQDIRVSIEDDIIFQIQMQVGAFLILSLVSITAVLKIFQPLYYLMDTAALHVKNVGNNINVEIFKILSYKVQMQNQITSLHMKIINISDIISKSYMHKSKVCSIYENFKYPQYLHSQQLLSHFGQPRFADHPQKTVQERLYFIQRLLRSSTV